MAYEDRVLSYIINLGTASYVVVPPSDVLETKYMGRPRSLGMNPTDPKFPQMTVIISTLNLV